jgi:hypothetical protein
MQYPNLNPEFRFDYISIGMFPGTKKAGNPINHYLEANPLTVASSSTLLDDCIYIDYYDKFFFV